MIKKLLITISNNQSLCSPLQDDFNLMWRKTYKKEDFNLLKKETKFWFFSVSRDNLELKLFFFIINFYDLFLSNLKAILTNLYYGIIIFVEVDFICLCYNVCNLMILKQDWFEDKSIHHDVKYQIYFVNHLRLCCLY